MAENDLHAGAQLHTDFHIITDGPLIQVMVWAT
jgi:hypothetical protein